MLCEECQMRPATVHIRRTINNETTERHLCQECARETGELNIIGGSEFSLPNLFATLLDSDAFVKHLGLKPDPGTLKCPACGLTYGEFKAGGRLGCDRCYGTYREQLTPLLSRLHGQVQHAGKIPWRAGHDLRARQELRELKQALNRAVEREAFEEAAMLRDRIRALEKKLGPGGE
ncbi:MAG: UvrB/UvrC motif-containing protein [bacterium]|jgi:protein arginine kinase activator|nr:hypothetical protein [Bacillota bacterium]